MRFEVNLSLPQEAVSVPLARRAVSAVLEQAGIDPECLDEVKVALSEACTNVLDHAGGPTSYQVKIAVEEQLLHMEVTDAGGAASGGLDRQVTMPEPMPERGRGAALMAALVDSLHFDTVTTGGTTVRMTKGLSWVDGAPHSRR